MMAARAPPASALIPDLSETHCCNGLGGNGCTDGAGAVDLHERKHKYWPRRGAWCSVTPGTSACAPGTIDVVSGSPEDCLRERNNLCPTILNLGLQSTLAMLQPTLSSPSREKFDIVDRPHPQTSEGF